MISVYLRMINLKRFTNSRKGNIVIDGAMFIIALFVFVMISYFGYKIYTDMSPYILEDLDHNESTAAFTEVEDRYPNVFSGLIVLVLVGFWAFVIVAAFLSNQHPIMFIFSIILIIFVIISAMILGNFYEEFFSDAEYGTITTEFAIPHFLMSHLLEISIGILMSGVLIAFARNKAD